MQDFSEYTDMIMTWHDMIFFSEKVILDRDLNDKEPAK